MSVEIVDRSDFIRQMKDLLEIDAKRTAIVTIDMHRGHLDPKVATMPCTREDSERVIYHTKRLLEMARSIGIPVIHVIVVVRRIPGLGKETLVLPFYQYLQKIQDMKRRLIPGGNTAIEDHNIEGSVQTEIIPELYQTGDYTIKNKKRLDGFYGTDLEMLLNALRVDTAVFTGINTNTCVLNTCFTAAHKGLKVVVISDCVASMYGQDLHIFALQNIQRCIGWVFTVDEFMQKVARGNHRGKAPGGY